MKYIRAENFIIFVDKIIFIEDVSKDKYYKKLGIASRIHTKSAVLEVGMCGEDIQHLIDMVNQ